MTFSSTVEIRSFVRNYEQQGVNNEPIYCQNNYSQQANQLPSISAFGLGGCLLATGIASIGLLLTLIFTDQFERVNFFDGTKLIPLDLTLDLVDFMPHFLYSSFDDHMGLALLIVQLMQTFELFPKGTPFIVILFIEDCCGLRLALNPFDALELSAQSFVDLVVRVVDGFFTNRVHLVNAIEELRVLYYFLLILMPALLLFHLIYFYTSHTFIGPVIRYIQLITMLTILVVLFQLVAILFFGIFARSDSTSTTVTSYAPLVNNCAILLLAFTLMYCPFRKLSLFSLASLLINVAATIQTYMLFGTFWDSCFNGFSSTFSIDVSLITRSLHACLLVLLTALDFIGLFCYWQAYLILAPILTIGNSLSGAILLRGLKIFDGGSGMLVFLYSGVSSVIIWAILIRDKPHLEKVTIKRSYINQVLGIIGLIVGFINWPKFNVAGALTSQYHIDTTSTTLAYLQNSALTNTFIALSISILISYFLAEKYNEDDQMQYDCTLDCFINGGISVASFQDIVMNPVACLIIAALSSALTLFVHKKYIKKNVEGHQQSFMRQYGRIVFRIAFSLLGVIICSIIVATRSGQTPNLITDSYSKIAGLQIVGMLIVIVIAALFGAVSALLIKAFLGSKLPTQEKVEGQKEQKKDVSKKEDKQLIFYRLDIQDDQYFLNIEDEIHPLYYEIFGDISRNLRQAQKAQEVSKEPAFSGRKNEKKQVRQQLLNNTMSHKQLEELQKNTINDDKQPPPKLIMKSNFTLENEKSVKKIVDLSTMKYQKYDAEDIPDEFQKRKGHEENNFEEEDDDLPYTLGETRKPPLPNESRHVRFEDKKQQQKSQVNTLKEDRFLKGSQRMVEMNNKMLVSKASRQRDPLSGGEVRNGSEDFKKVQLNKFSPSQVQ